MGASAAWSRRLKSKNLSPTQTPKKGFTTNSFDRFFGGIETDSGIVLKLCLQSNRNILFLIYE